MLDTGAQLNLLKIGSLKLHVHVNSNRIAQLTGITEDIVNTLGTVRIHFLGTPSIFHVIPDNFPIIPDNFPILGSSFFTENSAQIDYKQGAITWRNQSFPFKKHESIIIPARTNTGFVVRISNPELKTGYLPRLYFTDGIYVGDSLITCINGKGYIRAINAIENDVELAIPTVRLREVLEVSNPSPNSHTNVDLLPPILNITNVEELIIIEQKEITKSSNLTFESIKNIELWKPAKPPNSWTAKPSSEYSGDDLAKSFQLLFAQSSDQSRSSPSSSESSTDVPAYLTLNPKSSGTPSTSLNDGSSSIFTISTSPNSILQAPRTKSLSHESRDAESKEGSISNSSNFHNITPLNACSPRVKQVFDLLRIDHLNPKERENIYALVLNHTDRFNILDDYLDQTYITSHRITTTNESPIQVWQYCFPPIHKKEIVAQVSDLL